MEQPQFNTKEELIDWLVENKKFLIQQKKSELHKGDAISYAVARGIEEDGRTGAVKADIDSATLLKADTLKVEVVINTTNLMDSHRDVHFPGIWSKSVKENKANGFLLLQEHNMKFDHVISEGAKASVRTMDWVSLGFPFEGKTQALIFKAEISKDRNEFMFNQYAKGFVKNHSVGMRYVKLELASNDLRYPEEVAVWNKYIDRVANKEEVEENGYFWAITEAKIVEGSAVVKGSNIATPTLNISSKDNQDNEPPKGTQANRADEGHSNGEEVKTKGSLLKHL